MQRKAEKIYIVAASLSFGFSTYKLLEMAWQRNEKKKRQEKLNLFWKTFRAELYKQYRKMLDEQEQPLFDEKFNDIMQEEF